MTNTAVRPSRPAPARSRRWPVRGLVANIALLLIAGYILLAIFGSAIAPYGPNDVGAGPRLTPPSSAHWLGTDALGRDQLSRIVAAARPALLSATYAVLFAVVIGTGIGIAAGFLGRFWDGALSRIVDLLFAIPEYLLAILVIAVMGSGLLNASLAIGIVGIPRFARIARGSTLEVARRSFVDAARLCGRGRLWIVFRHILPNIASPLVIMTAINLSTAEGAYAALSFLGFGVRPPDADYGSMISSSQQYLLTDPWVVAFPSIAFVLLVLAFNLLGDVLRDRLDPHTRTAAGA
ncbi:ABC transporter permease [Peterkaempfera bronchialis]|uniref:ABC transporter permease n=1 Tax=Peterkaempfera bronchialis TaxID=2126346 RepID=A0A345T4L8_9ACTN|nr:ABC transporter permease [Peterkaempfera bronchialis]AXI80923.1 ABC transporter permease [Peterkaempfera bronchialis]